MNFYAPITLRWIGGHINLSFPSVVKGWIAIGGTDLETDNVLLGTAERGQLDGRPHHHPGNCRCHTPP